MSLPYSGNSICAFDVTHQRIWDIDHRNPATNSLYKVRQDVVSGLVKGKLYVFIRLPYNRSLSDNQLESLLDYIVSLGYYIEHVLPGHQYILRKV